MGAEFERFTGGLYRVAVIEGPRMQRAAALASGADVVVVNYEARSSSLDDLRLLAARSRVVLAVDESYNVKNPDASRTAAVGELREWCVRASRYVAPRHRTLPATSSPRSTSSTSA